MQSSDPAWIEPDRDPGDPEDWIRVTQKDQIWIGFRIRNTYNIHIHDHM